MTTILILNRKLAIKNELEHLVHSYIVLSIIQWNCNVSILSTWSIDWSSQVVWCSFSTSSQLHYCGKLLIASYGEIISFNFIPSTDTTRKLQQNLVVGTHSMKFQWILKKIQVSHKLQNFGQNFQMLCVAKPAIPLRYPQTQTQPLMSLWDKKLRVLIMMSLCKSANW